jgi:hypothetical protein
VIKLFIGYVGHNNLVLPLLQATHTEEILLVLLIIGCWCFTGIRPECFSKSVIQLYTYLPGIEIND